MFFEDRICNYDRHPYKHMNTTSTAVQGYENICSVIQEKVRALSKTKVTIVLDYYHGVREKEVMEGLIKHLPYNTLINVEDALLQEDELNARLQQNITEDRVFGVLSTEVIQNFFDKEKLKDLQHVEHNATGLTIVYGVGASTLTKGDMLLYFDLTRWEIQLRYRSQELGNWGVHNLDEDILRKYKRAYFVEWRVLDRHKQDIQEAISFYLDTNEVQNPKMVDGVSYRAGLRQFTSEPFRLVPYFDEGIWGGTWMEEVCGLEKRENNYAWCFDGVPEENSICMEFAGIHVQVPAINLVHTHPNALLGAKVHSRFGKEFPIRFDFLDTMNGGNLSLQVHPLTEYIQETFGMHYTQDESYYMLDTQDGACVYLGVKDGVCEDSLIPALISAQQNGSRFEDEKFINKIPVKKHDHILIPAGTIHCSGTGTMVLEISATPYIFTMKLYDWGRVGLDGKPRPINIEHGRKNIQYQRTTDWVMKNLVNNFQTLKEDEEYMEERTGLHELEFIETRRYTFHKAIHLHTKESVNMLNLIEGEEVCISSPTNAFTPYVIHYAETFIIPECVGEYILTPYGKSADKEIAVICASVRV